MPAVASPAAGTCRLTISGPSTRIELTVPAQLPLADVMPTVLGHLDATLAVTGLAHGGWVLRRIGELPLDEDLGATALGLRDGDVLGLFPREDQLAPVGFDDLVEGVAFGMRGRPGRWRPELTSQVLLGLVPPVLCVGLFGLLRSGSEAARAGIAWLTTLLLVVAVVAAGRAFGDRRAALLLGFGALGYAGLAGLLLPGGLARLVGVGVATMLVALALAAVAGFARPVLLAAALSAGLIAAGALAALLLPNAGSAAAAAVTLSLASLSQWAVPRIALRSVRRSGQDAPDRVERIHSALYCGLGVVCAVAFTVLLKTPGVYGGALVDVSSSLLLLHSGTLRVTWQRLGTVLPGLYGLLGLAVLGVALGGSLVRLLAPLACVVVAGLGAAAARRLPGRRYGPSWGRLATIVQMALAISVMPLVVGVLGGYTFVSDLVG